MRNKKVGDESTKMKREPIIYCGPNLPKGILLQFAVYREGIPLHLKKHIKSCPAIGRLFVPVSRLDATQSAISRAGSAEHIWADEIAQYIKKGALQ